MDLKKRADTQFYNVGKWIWAPMALFGYLMAYFIYPVFMKDNKLLACKFKAITGYPCPGCGGTRAFVSLFRRDIWASFCYNPTVIYCLLAYIEFMALYFTRLHITKTIEKKAIRVSYYFIGLAIVIMGQWVIRMIYLLFFI